MNRWSLTMLTVLARGVMRAVLLAHPRDFRRRFRNDVLDDISHDIRQAAAAGHVAGMRVATTAVVDAIAGLRVEKGASPVTRVAYLRRWLAGTWADSRQAVRTFAHERTFCASVIAILGLGIGVTAAMFGVVDRLLIRGPGHVRDAERVRRVQIATNVPGRGAQRSGWFGYVTYDALRREARSFEAVAAYSVAEDGAILGRGPEARRINRGEATANLFSMLGAVPALGRFYTDREDDTESPERVVVIGYGLWQRDFGGRRDVIDTPITLDNATYTIVGVAPRGFTGPDLMRVDVWMPESLIGRRVVSQNWTRSWNANWLSIVGRLEPGVAAEQAAAEVTAIFRRAYTGTNRAQAEATLVVQPLLYTRDGDASMESRISRWLLAVSAIVLAIACANVVNLLLAHAVKRRREVAVRLVLGATRGRLVRLLITEAVVLALAGGGAGLVIAYALGTVVRAWLIPGVEWTSGPVDGRVFGLALALSVAAGAVVGLLPALRTAARDVSASLKSGVREGGGSRSRLRGALTVSQAALSALLLVGAGLFLVSLQRVRTMDLGLQPDRVLTFSVMRSGLAAISDQAERERERNRRALFYPSVLEELRRRPDVEAASLAIGLAFTSGFGNEIHVPGRDSIPQLKGGGPYMSAVSADYFRTVGTRIVRGRGFTPEDRRGDPPVAVVNETMAATLWPEGDAIGKCFRIAQYPECLEIVGIAADTRQFKLREDESMAFYVAFGQEQGIGGTQLLVRPRGDAGLVLGEIRRALFALDPAIVFVYAGVLQDRVDPQMRPWQLGATMFGVMGLLAFVVAAAGLYSVMSYLVAQRAHEIGVRMALGARPADVSRLIVRGGLLLAGGGVAAGLGAAWLAGQWVEPLLFDTSPHDPAVFAAVAVTLLLMALAATALPASRARRVNPVDAMRTE